MKNIKAQLWIMTGLYAVSFFDGFLTLGLSDNLYALIGLAIMANLVWMWVDYNKSK